MNNKAAAIDTKKTAALLNTRTHYHKTHKPMQGRFNKSSLPLPIAVLGKLKIKPKKPPNAAGYWSLPCPFHKNGKEKHPSLNLHYINGNYRCHACGARGGDILDFYRKVTGKGFIESARDLNAWESDND